MIDIESERFTAADAVDAGLIDAVKRGETVIEGSYAVGKDGVIELRQRNFTFTDKTGRLRTGRFVNTSEMLDFCKIVNHVDIGED